MAEEPRGIGDIRIYTANDVRIQKLFDDSDETKQDVSAIKHALLGNGKPETGLVYRLARLEDWRRSIDWRVWVHIAVSAINFILLVLLAVRFGAI